MFEGYIKEFFSQSSFFLHKLIANDLEILGMISMENHG